MANLVRQYMPLVASMLRDYLGDPVIYRRDLDEYPVTLKLSRQPDESIVTYMARLIPDDLPVTPREGDQIEHGEAVYQVVNAIPDEYGVLVLQLRMHRKS